MNGPTATVPAAKAKLFQLASARPELSGVQVLDDDPGDTWEPEGIFIGDATGSHSYVVQRGPAPAARDENYTVDVQIWALLAGGTQAQAEARAFELFAVLERLVAEDTTLGGTVRQAGVGSFRVTAGQVRGEAGAVIEADVDISARLAQEWTAP